MTCGAYGCEAPVLWRCPRCGYVRCRDHHMPWNDWCPLCGKVRNVKLQLVLTWTEFADYVVNVWKPERSPHGRAAT
jgi:hypothetical protein